MKALQSLLIVSGLLAGSVFAQDNYTSLKNNFKPAKDYNVSIKQSMTDIYVKIRDDFAYVLRDVDMNFKVYSSDGKVITYKHSEVSKDGSHIFNIDLDKKGKYGYLLTFRNKGGVTHYVRGDLKI